MINEIESWITCKFESLSLFTLADKFNLRSKVMGLIQSRALHNLQLFKKNYAKQRHANRFYVPANLKSSLQKTKDKCKETPLIVLKLIRVSLADIKQLIPLFPNLKVIHLNRDPRGIFNSRGNLHDNKNRLTNSEIESHCQRWTEDLDSAKKLSQLYTGHIMTVRYENVAEDPQETIRNICHFIGIPYTKKIKEYLIKMTSANMDGCEFCLQRKNSTETAWKWRKELNFTMARFIYDCCKTGNNKLGYLPFDSEEELRDLDSPSHVD